MPIFCTLANSTIQGEETMDFEAVSYCWENVPEQTTIWLFNMQQKNERPSPEKSRLSLPQSAQAVNNGCATMVIG